MQQVLDNLKELPPGTGAKDIDLIFLRGIMESPIVRSLAKVRTISGCFSVAVITAVFLRQCRNVVPIANANKVFLCNQAARLFIVIVVIALLALIS